MELRARFPTLSVVGNAKAPRSGAFEVALGDRTLHSKLESGRFPRSEQVVDAIAAALGVKPKDYVSQGPAPLSEEEKRALAVNCAFVGLVFLALVAAVWLRA